MHLINYLDELKEATWAELQAYMQLTGVEIPPGECRIIILLGQKQERMWYKAEDANCPAPYTPEINETDLNEKSAQITSSFIARFKQ